MDRRQPPRSSAYRPQMPGLPGSPPLDYSRSPCRANARSPQRDHVASCSNGCRPHQYQETCEHAPHTSVRSAPSGPGQCVASDSATPATPRTWGHAVCPVREVHRRSPVFCGALNQRRPGASILSAGLARVVHRRSPQKSALDAGLARVVHRRSPPKSATSAGRARVVHRRSPLKLVCTTENADPTGPAAIICKSALFAFVHQWSRLSGSWHCGRSQH